MALNLQETDSKVILEVVAKPNSHRCEFRGEVDGALKIAVTEVAEKGKANQAIIKFLAKTLSLPKRNIALLSGTTSSRKKFLIAGLSLSELRSQLERHIQE